MDQRQIGRSALAHNQAPFSSALTQNQAHFIGGNIIEMEIAPKILDLIGDLLFFLRTTLFPLSTHRVKTI